jgi:hypothetical protein
MISKKELRKIKRRIKLVMDKHLESRELGSNLTDLSYRLAYFDIKISRQTLNNWYRGVYLPSAKTLNGALVKFYLMDDERRDITPFVNFLIELLGVVTDGEKPTK